VAFVRTKRVGEHEYRQLVENYRENGHHRQRVLAHLGQADTIEDAIENTRRKLADLDASPLAWHARNAAYLTWYSREQVEEKRTEYERRRQFHLDRIARLEQAARSLRGD
jgi:hypothetical protein